MWIIHPEGFWSAVKDGDRICVRARALQDLTNLRRKFCPELTKATSNIGRFTDYQWRAWCSQEEWANALHLMGETLEWSNVKDAVTKRQGRERHDIYLRVWAVLQDIAGKGQEYWRRWDAAHPRSDTDLPPPICIYCDGDGGWYGRNGMWEVCACEDKVAT